MQHINQTTTAQRRLKPSGRLLDGWGGDGGGAKRITKPFSTWRIAIVGAGLCGLAVALALEQSLVDDNRDFHDPSADEDDADANGTATTTRNRHCGSITIYERDESLTQQREGYGLTLSYRPGGTLDRLGILDALTDHDCPSRSHYILRGDGRFIGYYGHNLTGMGYGQRGNIRVPRRQARQVLLDRLRRTQICWGHRLVGLEEEKDDNGTTTMKLSFANGYSTVADLVIAADGIRSDVVRLQYPLLPPPRPLGVRIILGLTRPDDAKNMSISSLLCEQGFYTLEPGRRLFVMPYQGSARSHAFDPTEPVRYMWQLSFREDTSSASSSSPDDLLREAQDLTAGWHDPVPWLLQRTDVKNIWGTHLHDRDPTYFATITTTSSNETTTRRRVIVAGDALHAMSPFKGQGANQSLQDALTIAKWISGNGSVGGGAGGGDGPKLRYSVAVANCQRELMQRTAPMVQASREAAQYWHADNTAATATHAWAGVTDPAPLVAALAARTDLWHATDTTLLTMEIDKVVRNLVTELHLDVTVPAKPPPSLVLVQAAHAAAHAGCLRTLRRLSFECKDSLRCSDCLKIAARAGHLRVVHWLIKEGGCTCCPAVDFDTDNEDSIGNPVRALMARLCPNMIRPKETNAKPFGVLARTDEVQNGRQVHLISTRAVST
jgi:salicylate hydroxylase